MTAKTRRTKLLRIETLLFRCDDVLGFIVVSVESSDVFLFVTVARLDARRSVA